MGTHPIFESDFDCLTEEISKMGKIDNIRLRETLFLIVWSVSVYHAFLTGWSSQQCSTATRNDTTRHPVYSPTLFITGLPGSGQKLVMKTLQQHPFITLARPNGAVMERLYSYDEAWYAEPTKETERLNQAGVTESVFVDAAQQVLLDNVEWRRQTKILALSGAFMIDHALKWMTRCEMVDALESRLVHGNVKFEELAAEFGNFTRMVDYQRPLAGLVHLDNYRDKFRIEKVLVGSQWASVYQIWKGAGMMKKYSADQVRNYTRAAFERQLRHVSEHYPNGKVVFVVRDPRAFIAQRLKRAVSKEERRERYFALMAKWLKVHAALLAQCDKYQICQIVRYEDVYERPHTTLARLMETFRYQRLYAPRFRYSIEKNTTLDFWNATLPTGIEQLMIDDITLLNRLGYHPNKMTRDQYADLVELRPKSDPLRDIEVSEIDMNSLDQHLLSNMM